MKNEEIWNEYDARLSVVKRWGIAHTIQTQSVAEHCFNVERLALRIAKAWWGIHNPSLELAIIKWAHHHDDIEALMGDPPTMVKPYIDEKAMEEDHADIIPVNNPDSLVRAIVKLADILEGFRFICMERKLGNSYLENHYSNYYVEVANHLNKHLDHASAEVMLTNKVYPFMRYLSELTSKRVSRRGR